MADKPTLLTIDSAMQLVNTRAPAPPEPGGEWPKVMYHEREAPQGRIFQSEDEYLRCDVTGWSEKPIARIPLGMRRSEWEALQGRGEVVSSDKEEAERQVKG